METEAHVSWQECSSAHHPYGIKLHCDFVLLLWISYSTRKNESAFTFPTCYHSGISIKLMRQKIFCFDILKHKHALYVIYAYVFLFSLYYRLISMNRLTSSLLQAEDEDLQCTFFKQSTFHIYALENPFLSFH